MYEKRETDLMISYITDNQLQPQAIINTHAHLDHLFGVQAMMDKYNIQFGFHELDVPLLRIAASSASIFGVTFTNPPTASFFIKEGTMQLGDDTIDIFHTPGHSPGSISFYY